MLVNTESSDANDRALDVWEARIGCEAARASRLSLHSRRIGMVYGLAFIVFEIEFQIETITLGIELSVILFAVMIGCFVRSFLFLSVAKRKAAVHLEMFDSDRWAVPLQGVKLFDMWLAGRGKPGWPRKAARRY